METTTTIKVPVNVPKYYSIDLLKEQLTAYAQQLIAAAKPTKGKAPLSSRSPMRYLQLRSHRGSAYRGLSSGEI